MAGFKISLCLGVLLTLVVATTVDGCGCCCGGFRPPCCGPRPPMFGRPHFGPPPPCGMPHFGPPPPCGMPHFGPPPPCGPYPPFGPPHFGPPPPFGPRPPFGPPPFGPRPFLPPPPPPFIPRPPCIAPPPMLRPPPIKGVEGPITWVSIWVGNTRYLSFTYMGRTIKYVFPVNTSITISSLLAKFKITVNYQTAPTNFGSQGPISWYIQNGKLFFFYKTIVNGRLQIVKQKVYGIKSGSSNEIRLFLAEFKTFINFDKITEDIDRTDGAHFNFNCQFENGKGKITLFYEYYKNGQLVSSIKKQYFLKTGSDAEINAIIAKFEAYCKANTHVTVVTTKPVTGNIDWKTEYRNGSQYMIATYTEKQGDKVLRTLKKEYKMEDSSQATIDKHLAQFKEDLKNGKV